MYCTIHLLEIIRLSDFSSPLFYPSLLASISLNKQSQCITFLLRSANRANTGFDNTHHSCPPPFLPLGVPRYSCLPPCVITRYSCLPPSEILRYSCLPLCMIPAIPASHKSQCMIPRYSFGLLCVITCYSYLSPYVNPRYSCFRHV